MNESLKQLEFIKNQFAWIKSKVELDNQLGLYDINKLGEDIFMHILNDVYDLNLKNANDILHNNFPSIDLVDENSKRVVQVTSTTTLKKARETIEKLKDLKYHQITDDTSNSLKNSISFFRQLEDYEEYKISFLYINDKPNIKTKSWKPFLEEERVSEILFRQIERKEINILTLESACDKLDDYYESLGFRNIQEVSDIFSQIIGTHAKIIVKTVVR